MQLRSAPLRLLLLLLLLPPRFLRAKQEEVILAPVGSSVALPCVSPQSAPFNLYDLYVYWQVTVGTRLQTVAWFLGGEEVTCDPQAGCEWREGAQLESADMQRGNFTLRLADVGPQDEHSFHCLVFNSFQRVLECRVRLSVTASYSLPVVTSQEPGANGQLVFTCTSSNGYPQPTVHWFDWTDGRPLDPSLCNSTLRPNARGLYDVLSVLRLQRPGPAHVGCCVENARLGKNVCSSMSEASFRISTTPRPPQETSTSTLVLLAVGVVTGVGIAVAAGWVCRNRWSLRRYTGVQDGRWARQLPDHGGRVV